jgi:hypothetical protein
MIRVFSRDKNGRYRWFDRETGYPVHAPFESEVRKDAIGRPIDDEGTNVPYGSIASEPVSKPPVIGQTRIHVYDSLGRSQWKWRETNRFAPKPGMSDIKYDKSGRPRDDAGKPIPRTSYKHDIIEPAPETKVKRRTFAAELPTKSAKTDDSFRYPLPKTGEMPDIEPGKYSNYSHGNRSNGYNLDTVFAEAFTGHIAKGPFEIGDIDIYRYGAQIRLDRRLSSQDEQNIKEYLGKFPDTSVRFIQEQRVTTFQIVWGDNEKGQLVRDVFMELKQRKQILQDLLDWFDTEGDYYDWYAWFDTEEQLYEYH